MSPVSGASSARPVSSPMPSALAKETIQPSFFQAPVQRPAPDAFHRTTESHFRPQVHTKELQPRTDAQGHCGQAGYCLPPQPGFLPAKQAAAGISNMQMSMKSFRKTLKEVLQGGLLSEKQAGAVQSALEKLSNLEAKLEASESGWPVFDELPRPALSLQAGRNS